MTQNELNKVIFWQLIAFAKLEENPQTEFSTSPVLFEFAKTKGIQNTLSVFKLLEKYNFLSTNSPTFQTISLTQKAFSLEKNENIEKMIFENNQLVDKAIQKGNFDFVEDLKNENEVLKNLMR